ncbi:uncharacterized protein CLUP02_08258 [Colletotrichum lupini]|uniref:Uncharacterized protein n=1 Tax=Colletotrichum lupini TaxID=145971 RepID=A0A9Q8SSR9_9PEZI|nr:uncharacterized protein CLUP02_08258 [Colletotrichum lupini]UQC82768.1 hypothetical protein CLUP02_08258 [Colletotrichum lupini]
MAAAVAAAAVAKEEEAFCISQDSIRRFFPSPFGSTNGGTNTHAGAGRAVRCREAREQTVSGRKKRTAFASFRLTCQDLIQAAVRYAACGARYQTFVLLFSGGGIFS